MDAFKLIAKMVLDKQEFDSGMAQIEAYYSGGGGTEAFSKWGVMAGNLASQAFTRIMRGAAQFVGSIFTTGMDFDEMMSTVKAVGNMSETEFEQVRKRALDLGASTKFTAEEVGEAFYYMGLAGWKSEEMLDGIDGVLDLAAASGENLGRVSDIVTDAITAMGLTAEDAGHFVDVLAAASTNSNTTVSQMGEAFKYLATTGGVLQYSIEDVATVLGLLANNGIKGSQAGTSMRKILNTLIAPSEKAANAMEKLGLSLFEMTDGVVDKRKPLMQVVEELRTIFKESDFDLGGKPIEEFQQRIDEFNDLYDQYKKTIEENGFIAFADGRTLNDMEDVENWYKNIIQDLTGFNEEFLGNLSQVGGLRGISSLFALMNSTDADVEQLSNAVVNSEGRASGMAQTLLDNLQGDVTILNSAIDGLKIALFDEVNPLAREFVQILTSGVSEVTEMIRGKNGDAVDQAIQREKEAIGGAEADAAKASGIVGYMDTLVAEYGDAAKNTESWAAALKKLEEVMPGITREIKDQSGSASDMTKSMKEYIELTKEQKIEAARQKAVEEYQKIADEAKANLEKAQIQQAVEGGGAESYLTSILEYIAGKQGVEDTGAFVSQWKEYLAGRKDRNLIIDKMIEPYLEEGGEYNYTLGELVESWEESLESYGTNTAEIDRLTDLYNKAEAKLQAANAAYGYLTSAAYDYANNLTGGVGGETDGSHAKGDWFVPYDNYVANLHRGEMVLTASQARRFREGTQTAMDMEALRSAIVSAVMEGMENAQVNAYMDGRRVTEEVSRRLNNELALRR